MTQTVDRAAFRFIPGPFQYSAGVAARPGFAIRRVRFANPVPLADGFARIEAWLGAEGLPLSAFCACELRSPAPFTEDGFVAFNRLYVGTLERWGIVAGDVNPVARSNVCPELDKPETPSFHAFSVAAPAAGAAPSFVAAGAAPSFVVAGSAEAREGGPSYRERTVRWGETGPEAMAEKIRFVMGQMEARMAALGAGWPQTTGTQVYTVQDIHPHLAAEIIARGAARHGIAWHYCRPPVVNLEYEMDCRGVQSELVLA